VLELAGLKETATDVLFIGLDTESPEEGFRRVLPIEKALDPDTLLAYALNGATLPKDHGYPVRALVPGWVGSSSIKWLGRIVVSSEKIWTRNNTQSYVLIGDSYPPEGEALGQPVTTQTIKSSLALPWPASLPAGTQRIHGFAHSPVGGIAKVEWSTDGQTWQEAALVSPQIQYSWVRFEFWWDAEPGEHTLWTRATDVEGNTQPDSVPFNVQGYLFNQPVPHPVTVL
jgi:sulfane dehydrogenase subunit SoxC